MKKRTHLSAVVAAALLAAGCATTFRPWKLSEIREGMDEQQVVSILGEPDSVEARNGARYLNYTYLENYNPAPAVSPLNEPDMRTIRQNDALEQSFKTYRYEVMLVDGKVVNYKELNP